MAITLWTRWKRFAHRAAEIQSLIVLTLLYWVIVVPIGLVRRLGGRVSSRPEWTIRSAPEAVSIEEARRQS
jgi:hypothetical protein